MPKGTVAPGKVWPPPSVPMNGSTAEKASAKPSPVPVITSSDNRAIETRETIILGTLLFQESRAMIVHQAPNETGRVSLEVTRPDRHPDPSGLLRLSLLRRGDLPVSAIHFHLLRGAVSLRDLYGIPHGVAVSVRIGVHSLTPRLRFGGLDRALQ